MTNTEIKKLYTQTKKALEKRTGEKFTWVMNAKQQRLGTATVCVAYATDSVAGVERARARANGKAKAEATRDWEAFKRHADEEEATGGSSWNPRFWRDKFDTMGTLEEYVAKKQASAEEDLENAERFLAEHGTQAEIVKDSHEYARQLIAGPEISKFLASINGSATIEDQAHNGGVYIYIRFHYTATEA